MGQVCIWCIVLKDNLLLLLSTLFIALDRSVLFVDVFNSNLAVMLFKFGAYLYSGSATMLSESIHSLADMLNQVWYDWIYLHLAKKGNPCKDTLKMAHIIPKQLSIFKQKVNSYSWKKWYDNALNLFLSWQEQI